MRQTRGSILLLTLMVCLGIAVLISTFAAVTAAGRYALRAERTGRQDLADADTALTGLVDAAWREWVPSDSISPSPSNSATTVGLRSVDGSGDRHLLAWTHGPAMAATPGGDPSLVGSVALETSAWVERGADGFTVPSCVVEAERVTTSPGRDSSAVNADSASQAAIVRSTVQPEAQVIGAGVEWQQAQPWVLDEGTALLAEQQATRPGAALMFVPGRAGPEMSYPCPPCLRGRGPRPRCRW